MTLGPLPSVALVVGNNGEVQGLHTGTNTVCAPLCVSKRAMQLEIGSGNSSDSTPLRRGGMAPEASKEMVRLMAVWHVETKGGRFESSPWKKSLGF